MREREIGGGREGGRERAGDRVRERERERKEREGEQEEGEMQTKHADEKRMRWREIESEWELAWKMKK